MRERTTVAQTVDDVFGRKVGIRPQRQTHPRLLRLFDDPPGDNRTWVISAALRIDVRDRPGVCDRHPGAVDADGRIMRRTRCCSTTTNRRRRGHGPA